MADWSGQPAYMQVAGTLRAEIRGGRIPPGSQLPSYEALMRKYGVSITVVRSAVRELKTEGLVLTHQGKGAFVRDPLPVNLLDIPTLLMTERSLHRAPPRPSRSAKRDRLLVPVE